MSYEEEEDKKWAKKPIYIKLSYVAACIVLGLILFPLALLIGIKERILGKSYEQ